jgi:CheY-like chemotaxis protein
MAKKILLADDSITIQKVIELTFSDEDFDVVTVGNGRLALEKLAEVRPDIVLCDIIMPEKDGYEVCQHIKANEAFAHVPVLLLTGAFEPFDQEKAVQVGSDGFLAKPFEPETLIAKVKDLLGRAAGAEGAPPGAEGPAASGTTAPTEFVSPPPAEPAPPEVTPSRADDPAATTTAPQPALSAPAAEPSPPEAAFIPEEPFATFDAGAIDEAPSSAPTPPEEPLAPVTPEESATLAGAGPGDSEDSASTVMFTPGDLPWTAETPPGAPAEPPPPPEPPAAPAFVSEPPGAPDLAEEAGAAFEEVLEEDLDLGGAAGMAAGTPADLSTHPTPSSVFTPGEPLTEAVADAAEPPGPSPTSTAPPTEYETPTAPTPQPETFPPLMPETPATPSAPEPPPSFEVDSPPVPEPAAVFERPPELAASFEAPSEPPKPVASFELPSEPPAPAASFEPSPEPPSPAAPFEPSPAPPAPPPPPVFEVATPPGQQQETLPPLEPEAPVEPAPEPQLAPLAGPEPPPEPEREAQAPSPAPSDEAVSFADVQTTAEPESGPVSSSEAASVPVPVEQVEKIAQRVVAQVSEKIVREIAWEVIPDLAEALIKQEIERLKAELEKL